jgi:DNA-binding NtrC family response regulator
MLAGRKGSEVSVPRFAATVERGPDQGLSATLQSTSLKVGSAANNDLVLTDPTVSRHHLMLTATQDGILAEDLGSRNGTLLGESRIRSAFVQDGGLLRVGETLLRLKAAPGRYVVFPDEASSLAGILGESAAMRDIFALLRQLARSDLPVAITGETGSGKELVARALHELGPRRERKFLVLDCGGIVPELLRSELFGHERGAFTGAERTTKGILEEAAGGTVFLDEVGELEASIQPKLLRALETREVTRLGSHQAIPVDFRIVSATNRDLKAAAAEGRFRPDLYYRLSCVTVRLPPLRERAEDIPLLAAHFLDGCARRNGLPIPLLSPGAMTGLQAGQWPGNVRQLKNVLETLCVLSGGKPISEAQVRAALADGGPDKPPPAPAEAPQLLEEIEKAAIEEALKATGWNRKGAARRLGISPTTIFEKIRRYGLKPPGPDEG